MGTRSHVGWWAVTATAVTAACFLGLLAGCAIGRDETTGKIIAGAAIGELAETTNQAISQLANMVVPGAGGALGLLGAVGLGWARSHAAAKSSEAARAAADREWEAAETARKLRDRDRLLAAADPASVSRVVAGVVPPPVAAPSSP